LGYRIFPYVPVIDLHKYWDALKPLVLTPQFTAYEFYHYTVMWLTVAALLETVVREKRSSRFYVYLAVFVLAAKVIIISKDVTLDEAAGIGIAYGIWLAILGLPSRTRALTVVLPLYLYVLLWRLEPFDFQVPTRSLGLSLFHGIMSGGS